MRAIHLLLIASAAATAGAAPGQDGGNAGAAQKTEVAPIQFDLSARQPRTPGKLPTATSLDELTYATEDRPAAQAAPKPKPTPVAKPKPKPKPARKAVAAKTTAKGPWMSEWRRAYIARHGHPPPVPARWGPNGR
jgi:hypothetical protein